MSPRDFSAELRARIRKMDRLEPETPAPVVPEVKRYNIHKRSLPVGIDKIVVIGVTKAEADWWIENRLQTRCYENAPYDSKTIIYYDVLPIDAKPVERSIYFNSRPVTKE